MFRLTDANADAETLEAGILAESGRAALHRSELGLASTTGLGIFVAHVDDVPYECSAQE